MNIMRTIQFCSLGILLVTFSFLSCTKQEIPTFDAAAAVNFGKIDNANSVTYSFMANPEDDYIQEIPVVIMGDTANYDRSFEVQVVNDSNTTASPAQYKILGGVVKAGEITGTLSVQLFKSPELDNSTVSLKLKLVNSEDFKAGNVETSDFIIRWTNKVVVPSWSYFRYFFTSVASTAAYRLIVQTTGLTTLTARQYSVDIGAAGVQALATKFGDYVKQWNKDHPNDKLKHDDGTKAGEDIVPLYYTHSKYD
jgi:hypothetical protein